MRKGVAAARSGRIVTFGIKPSRPETGYGYIEVEEGAVSQSEATDVRCFVEKPDLRTAEGFFQSGRHYWNAGIFLCSAKTLLRRSEEHTSELQSLMRISYAVFCLKKKKHNKHITY